MKQVLYLTFDSIQEGVGASQALAYVKKIAQFREIELVSFEKEFPDDELIAEIASFGIIWKPLPFGRFGAIGGIGRIFRLWRVIDRSNIIHARGNFAAIAAMLRFPRFWIWDSRALHSDQRKAMSGEGVSVGFLLMRIAEFALGRRSSAIIAITNAVIPIYISRYRVKSSKIHVISTCVDLDLFKLQPPRDTGNLKILLQGTFSSAYDVKLMNKIIKKFRESETVKVTICTSKGSTDLWKDLDFDHVLTAKYSEMPEIIAQHDFGMSIWKEDLGVCLKSVASTKVGEFLAIGRPIFVNRGQGDLSKIFTENSVGVLTEGDSDSEVESYVSEMRDILINKRQADEFKEAVDKNFTLDKAIHKLMRIYSLD